MDWTLLCMGRSCWWDAPSDGGHKSWTLTFTVLPITMFQVISSAAAIMQIKYVALWIGCSCWRNAPADDGRKRWTLTFTVLPITMFQVILTASSSNITFNMNPMEKYHQHQMCMVRLLDFAHNTNYRFATKLPQPNTTWKSAHISINEVSSCKNKIRMYWRTTFHILFKHQQQQQWYIDKQQLGVTVATILSQLGHLLLT